MKTLKAFLLAVILTGPALGVGQYHPDPVAAPSSSSGNNAALTIGASVAVTGLIVWFFHRHRTKTVKRATIQYHVKL